MIASANAERAAKKLLGNEANKSSLGYEAVFENEATAWVLWYACRDPKDISKSAFPTPDLAQDGGQASRAALVNICAGQWARATVVDVDRYRRLVAAF